MLNFDKTRFLTIQQGAVALASGIDTAISAALAAGATNLFFLGTGGVAYLMEPAIQLLQRHSGFPVFREYPAELLVSGNRNLTAGSIVIVPSLSGTTTESVALLDRLHQIGAQVITLTVRDKPTFAGVDPYNKRIDRNSGDNVTRVKVDG